MEPSWPTADAPCPHCGHLLWFDGSAARNEPLASALSAFVPPQAVVDRLEVQDKAAAIAVLVNRLCATDKLAEHDAPDVIAAITRREELGSTGIGRGWAIPHAKHPGVRGAVGAIGYLPKPIDFNSLDGQPVHTVILLVSGPDRPGDQLRAMEKIRGSLGNVDSLAIIYGSRSPPGVSQQIAA